MTSVLPEKRPQTSWRKDPFKENIRTADSVQVTSTEHLSVAEQSEKVRLGR